MPKGFLAASVRSTVPSASPLALHWVALTFFCRILVIVGFSLSYRTRGPRIGGARA